MLPLKQLPATLPNWLISKTESFKNKVSALKYDVMSEFIHEGVYIVFSIEDTLLQIAVLHGVIWLIVIQYLYFVCFRSCPDIHPGIFYCT